MAETATGALAQIEETIGTAIETVGPAVVGLGRGWHGGSGVVVGEDRVLTCAHNVRGEEVTVALSDGRRAVAEVAGVDRDLDLAALAVDTGDIAPVELDGAAPARAGQAVVALATPGGRGLRATLGFVSAADRSFRGARGRRITGCVEHTAPLPRGSSGGPLVDVDGGLLGLNAVRLQGGLILAVPAGARARRSLEALWRGEETAPVRLGVAVAPPDVARRLRRAVGLPETDGVLVRAVEDSSAASRAGVKEGDLIVRAGDRAVETVDSLYEALDEAKPGGDLVLKVLRGTEEHALRVVFDAPPTEVRS